MKFNERSTGMDNKSAEAGEKQNETVFDIFSFDFSNELH